LTLEWLTFYVAWVTFILWIAVRLYRSRWLKLFLIRAWAFLHAEKLYPKPPQWMVKLGIIKQEIKAKPLEVE